MLFSTTTTTTKHKIYVSMLMSENLTELLLLLLLLLLLTSSSFLAIVSEAFKGFFLLPCFLLFIKVRIVSYCCRISNFAKLEEMAEKKKHIK